jgi:hypothetical protein
VCEHTVEIEVHTDLTREKRVQIVEHNSPREQVRMPTSKLPGAGSRQQELESPRVRIDDCLDAIQELRNALNLVDEDGSRRRRHRQELPLEAFGLCNEFAKCRQARKVQREVWLERAEERRLPDLARAEQQDVMAFALQSRFEKACIHVGKM